MNHEEPDRVPRDLGTVASGIHIKAYGRLIEHLGLGEDVSQEVYRGSGASSFLARLPEALLRHFDIDVRTLRVGAPEGWSQEKLSDGSFIDEWGVKWAKPEGGHYKNVAGPFQQGEPTLADLERHPWPDPRDPGRIAGLKEEAIRLRRETDCAIVLGVYGAIVHRSQLMRGFAEWLEDLVLNPVLAEAMMEYCVAYCVPLAEIVLKEVGDYVDVVVIGDDYGIQDRCYVRPELFRQRIKPYLRRMVEAIKSKTKAKMLLHSDGSVYSIIPDLIDVGVDALNPIQVSAKDMDTRRLKAEFGQDLSFWGAIDTNRVLPRGTPEDVRREVNTRIRDLAPGGGYMLASVHDILAEVPPENIVAMFDAAEEYGRY